METRSRILIVDDEDVVLDSCLQVFEGEDYEVATARDGKSGLAMVPEFAPDLILVDLKMPGISGFEVLETLHAADPTLVAIVITGYSTVGSAVEAMKKGAFDFLPKPFTPDELRVIARRGLERRRLVLETIALRREREMLRENFAAIISHELRSPLSAVQQNLFALGAELADRLSDEQKGRLERLQGRVADLLGLIQTWLRAVSVPVDKIKEGFAPVAVAPAIERAIESVQPHATRKAITVRAAVAGPLPAVRGDAGSLTEAFVNLIGNAVKYSHAGSEVTVRAQAEPGVVVVAVEDHGVGIAPEDLQLVFGDFYRGKTAPAGESGSGLGLALTRRIIDAHEGAITVTSEVGKGTTFTVRLPSLPAENQDPAAAVAAGNPTSDPGETS